MRSVGFVGSEPRPSKSLIFHLPQERVEGVSSAAGPSGICQPDPILRTARDPAWTGIGPSCLTPPRVAAPHERRPDTLKLRRIPWHGAGAQNPSRSERISPPSGTANPSPTGTRTRDKTIRNFEEAPSAGRQLREGLVRSSARPSSRTTGSRHGFETRNGDKMGSQRTEVEGREPPRPAQPRQNRPLTETDQAPGSRRWG